MQCRDFRELADSYMSDELLVETNHEVIAHLEACAECRRELTTRRELRATLRAAFANKAELQIDDQFAARLRSQLHASALRQSNISFMPNRAWLAIAACLVVAAGLTMIVVRNGGRPPSKQSSAVDKSVDATTGPTAITSPDVPLVELASVAVGDHRNCAIEFHLPEAPIALEEAGQKYDRAYIALEKTVKERLAKLSDAAVLIEAHSCIFAGRRFAHLVLKENDHLVSFLITDVDGPERKGQSTTPAGKDGQVISCSEVHGYRVSCFQTARHAVFVVSDLNEESNLSIARLLAPAIHKHLSDAESIAEILAGDQKHA